MLNKLSERRRLKVIGVTCGVMLMLAGLVMSADTDEGSDADLKIERVALFKNGLGYFTSSAILPKGATIVKVKQLPVPSHGTFWISYPQDLKVNKLVTSKGEKDVEATWSARDIAGLLHLNPGRQVTLFTSENEGSAIKGTLIEVVSATPPVEESRPSSLDIRSSSRTISNLRSPASSLIVIKIQEGTVALNAKSISRVDFESDDITTSVPNPSTTKTPPSIRIELEKEAKGQEIGVSYLTRGITWSPSYLIDISDSKTAKLSSKAVVVNEVTDLKAIHLDLVTGFPNIRFGDVNSPVAMSENLAGFLKALTTGRSESGSRGNMMRQQAMISNTLRSESDMFTPAPGYSTASEGLVAEDLFFYPVESFTLLRGETACLPLFTAEVPYKHIYIWKIPDMLDESEQYRQNRDNDEQALAEEVWHSCRLVNNMDMPWTTAAAEFVNDGQFTGQDICYYTAPGAETTIRINRAMNVVAEEAEVEVERERNAASFHGYSYDLVRVKGELKLQNRQSKAATLEVTKDLTGEVVESTPQAKDIPTAKGLRRVNTRHVLVWEIELKPGQEQTLSYTYEVYLRN